MSVLEIETNLLLYQRLLISAVILQALIHLKQLLTPVQYKVQSRYIGYKTTSRYQNISSADKD